MASHDESIGKEKGRWDDKRDSHEVPSNAESSRKTSIEQSVVEGWLVRLPVLR